MNREYELLKIVNKWLYHNEKMREINKYLYEHTELFEKEYMSDFPEELYAFFAGKITRFTNDYNRLKERLSERQIRILNKIKLLEE